MADQPNRLSAAAAALPAGRGNAAPSLPLLAGVPRVDSGTRRGHYDAALAFGANATRMTADREAQDTPTVLLTNAGILVPAITRAAYSLEVLLGGEEADADPDNAEVVPGQARALCRNASGALRLTHRALLVHARNVHYDPTPYPSQAIRLTEDSVGAARAAVDRRGHPGLTGTIDEGQENVSMALQALEVNRGAVPGHLAAALAAWFALYLVGRAITPR